jgi:hypothetical protein
MIVVDWVLLVLPVDVSAVIERIGISQGRAVATLGTLRGQSRSFPSAVWS